MAGDYTRRNFLRHGAVAGTLLALEGCTSRPRSVSSNQSDSQADLILRNARIATLDQRQPAATALAIQNGKFVAVGDEQSVHAFHGPGTRLIDAHGAVIIPGLNDSHLHLIRGGLN